MSNVSVFLDNRAKADPDMIAVVHPSSETTYTYHELASAVHRISGGLIAQGISIGDRVAIFLDSSPEYLISYFAIWRMGGIVVPTNIVYKEKELIHILNDSQATAIICDAAHENIVERLLPDAPTVQMIITTGSTTKSSPQIVSWGQLLVSAPLLESVSCNLDTVCQIQYTSGTTGAPKGAMLTHGGWIAALDNECDILDLVRGDMYLGIYPMGHVGLSWGISILKAGGTYICLERFEPERYLSLIEQYQVTVLSSMPPVIHMLAEAPDDTEQRIKTVRVLISGGGPLHSPTWKAFHARYNRPIVNAYGLSETIVLGAGTAIRPYHYQTADEYNSVGTPVGYTEVCIVDQDRPKHHLPSGEVGEIALRGPGLALGYWNRPVESGAVFLSDGWFLTGDIGYLDSDGMLVITDRKKDMIIMSGWKIYPTEVEQVLIHHPKIAELAVFGCSDEEKGEIPVVAVVLSEGVKDFSHDELAAYAKERLAGYKVPRRTYIVSQLPRLNGWKLLRGELQHMLCPSPDRQADNT
ncbi:MAG: acyl--CoA ligase [Euryarchaeota archaeon]|nr:acyl--CoA ligase [Euryarchaeota archaeon]